MTIPTVQVKQPSTVRQSLHASLEYGLYVFLIPMPEFFLSVRRSVMESMARTTFADKMTSVNEAHCTLLYDAEASVNQDFMQNLLQSYCKPQEFYSTTATRFEIFPKQSDPSKGALVLLLENCERLKERHRWWGSQRDASGRFLQHSFLQYRPHITFASDLDLNEETMAFLPVINREWNPVQVGLYHENIDYIQ
jgi:hypothetical protein